MLSSADENNRDKVGRTERAAHGIPAPAAVCGQEERSWASQPRPPRCGEGSYSAGCSKQESPQGDVQESG